MSVTFTSRCSGTNDVVDDDVVGTGRPHARGVPDVLDADLRRRAAAPAPGTSVIGPTQRADHHPVGGHDAGRPGPAAAQPHPAVDGHAAPGRRQRGRAQHRSVGEHLVLGLLAEQRQHPVVQDVEPQGPGAGWAAVRHSAHRVQDRAERRLLAAVAGRQQQPAQTAVAEVGDRRIRQPPQVLGLGRPLRQPVDEFVGDARHDGDATPRGWPHPEPRLTRRGSAG